MRYFLAIKEKKHSSSFIFDGSTISSNQTSIIALGSKFKYKHLEGSQFISSKGPLLGSVIIGVKGPVPGQSKNGRDIEVVVKYVIEAKEDTLSSTTR